MSALQTEFRGERGDLFQLAMKTGFLTVFTFGFYRFWQTTRFRRWYWSAIRPGGAPFEYTGTGQEKLMGFLAAIVVLAFYLALFNAAVMLALVTTSDGSLTVLNAGLALTPLALVPVIFMARYRARRYILARTRWRGIRFAMSPGAWGYAWRACLWSLIGILSFGLLWPTRTFKLEKYLTDRTWFGSARFSQCGRASQLYGLYLPFFLCLWGTIGMVAYGVDHNTSGLLRSLGVSSASPQPIIWPFMAVYIAGPLTWLFWVYYRVASFRLMAGMKVLGDGLEFEVHPKTRRLVTINILGSILTSFCTGLFAVLILAVATAVAMALDIVDGFNLIGFGGTETIGIAAILLFGFAFVAIYVFAQVFRQVFITFPMVRHATETLQIHEPTLFGSIRQRDRDDPRDAGGFAEALDVGAAF